MKIIDRVHERGILPRRAQRLADLLADLIPQNASVLDVGSGDGQIDELILEKRSDVKIHGLEVSFREKSAFPVTYFDGKTLPFGDSSFDVVMFVDVLHHTDDPMILLREAVRVTIKHIAIKDHLLEGLLAGMRLRFMDYVGNARHGVALPFNYWTGQQWEQSERSLGLQKRTEVKKLGLYPWAADWVFGADLHFIALYDVAATR